MLSSILLGVLVLTVIVAAWFLVCYRLSPHVEDPDGVGRITGKCGDTMEISLRFRKGRVEEAAYWTNGCAYSLNCVCAAARLAEGKTPEEILEIDPDLVQRSVGGLPSDQMHCAVLSVETLNAALDDYMKKITAKAPCLRNGSKEGKSP